MPLNVAKFFDPSRLFHLQPAIALSTIYFLLVAFGILVIASIVVKFLKKNGNGDNFLKNLYEKYFSVFLTMGIIGLVLTWFRYERVYVFSARFWLLLWFIGLVSWLTIIFRYQFKTIPQLREKKQKTREFNKYLPKKK